MHRGAASSARIYWPVYMYTARYVTSGGSCANTHSVCVCVCVFGGSRARNGSGPNTKRSVASYRSDVCRSFVRAQCSSPGLSVRARVFRCSCISPCACSITQHMRSCLFASAAALPYNYAHNHNTHTRYLSERARARAFSCYLDEYSGVCV